MTATVRGRRLPRGLPGGVAGWERFRPVAPRGRPGTVERSDGGVLGVPPVSWAAGADTRTVMLSPRPTTAWA